MKQQLTPGTKYIQGWFSILGVVIFSFVNIILISFTEWSIPLSSYISEVCTVLAVYPPEGETNLTSIYYTLAVICIIPYIFCTIFGKRRVGWIITALVFFSLDSLFLMSDFVLSIATAPETLGLYGIEIAVHTIILVSIIRAVISGFQIKRDKREQIEQGNKSSYLSQKKENLYTMRDISLQQKATAPTQSTIPLKAVQPTQSAQQIKVANPNYNEDLDIDNIKRIVTIERPGNMYGKFASFKCFIDDELVCSIANNDNQEIEINGRDHVLSILASEMTGKRSYFDIKKGSSDIKLRLKYSPSTQGAPKINDVTNEEETQ